MEQRYKIELDLSAGSFSISGSESFIDAHLEEIKNFISNNEYLNSSLKADTDNHKSKANLYEKESNKKQKSTIYNVNSDKTIEILKPIPGKNTAAKMKNVTLITLYAKEQTENIKSVNREEITKLCLKGGCLDSHNMKDVLKRSSKLFILNQDKKQDKRSWSVELTTDGEIEAKKLIKKMSKND